MARFKKIKVDPSKSSVDELWKLIQGHMLISQSVELVAVAAPGNQIHIEVRAWTDVRKDESNADNASPNKEY